MRFLTLIVTVLLLCAATPKCNAQYDSLTVEQINYIDSFNKSLDYQAGIVMLSGGLAILDVPKEYKYLNAKQSQMVLTDLWGNPKREDVLGMILPTEGDVFNNDYAFIISYEEMGHVKDEDADKINYDDLLKEIQGEEEEVNKERAKLGYSTMHLVGWAQKPFYDKDKKVLHWAKNLHFEGDESNTLNYEVRILGRNGVLSLNAVAGIDALPLVNQNINKVLAIPAFGDKNKYTDFDPGIDKVAAYTIGGLVAGKVLAKAGILVLLLKFWKLILGGFVVLGAAFRKFIPGWRKKKENEAKVQATDLYDTPPFIPETNTDPAVEKDSEKEKGL